MFKWLIITHVLGATIWVGGHLLLAVRYLPEALRDKNLELIKAYEKKFEIIGFPALIIQVITGVWMAITFYQVNFIDYSSAIAQAVGTKLILLLATILLAINVRFFVFPKLTPKNLWWLGLHIIAVTLIGICMLYLGVSIRFGGV